MNWMDGGPEAWEACPGGSGIRCNEASLIYYARDIPRAELEFHRKSGVPIYSGGVADVATQRRKSNFEIAWCCFVIS